MSLTTFDVSQSPSNQPNILDNGGFDIWQRGNTFTNPATNVYTADRWMHGSAGTAPTATITKETSVTDGTATALKWNITSNAGNTQAYMLQYVENYLNLRGKTVTFSVRSNTSASGFLLGIYDGVGINTVSIPSNASYATYSVTLTVSASATQLFVFWGNNAGAVPTGTFYLDSAMLTVGPNPAAFVPLHPQVDLARCQRYYAQGLLEISALGRTNATQYVLEQSLLFAVPMRTTPTMSFSSASVWEEGSNTNQIGSYSVAINSTVGGGSIYSGFTVSASKNIAGNKPSFLSGNWSASSDL